MTIHRRGFLALLGSAATVALIPPGAFAQDAAPAPVGIPPLRRPPTPSATLVDAARLNGQVGFAAIATDGTTLDARDDGAALPPASTLKTVTALYALDRLGAQHRFTTRVHLDGDTLILAGGGDPVLDSDGLDALAALASEAAAGRTIARFAVWGGALPYLAEIAPPQDDHLAYNPSLSGLNLNFNRVFVNWRGGQLSLTARGDDVAPRAYSVTIATADRSAPLFAYHSGAKAEAWTIASRSMGKSGSSWLPVRRPDLYAGDVFQTLCRARGLVLPSPERTDAAPGGEEIARHDSPPLTEILQDLLHYSTNLTAEVVGLTASGATDLATSGRAMADWLRARGLAGDFQFADHSGLSPDSRISAGALARMLAAPDARAALTGILKSDPLSEALGAESRGGEVRAKTGTLNFVSNLAGYGPGGFAFAILTADEARMRASAGTSLPDGVLAWTARSKRLQRDLIERFAQLPAPTSGAALMNMDDDPRG